MSASLLVFDTETTGLTLHPDVDVKLQPQMIEFGGAILSSDDGRVVERFSILINPGVPLPAEIVRITGITDADLIDAPDFLGALPQLRRVFEGITAVFAHNLPFDKAILLGELARAGLVDFPWPPMEFCTAGLYQSSWGRRPKLTQLYAAVMGRPFPQQHRAMSDVNALVEIIQKEELWLLATV